MGILIVYHHLFVHPLTEMSHLRLIEWVSPRPVKTDLEYRYLGELFPFYLVNFEGEVGYKMQS